MITKFKNKNKIKVMLLKCDKEKNIDTSCSKLNFNQILFVGENNSLLCMQRKGKVL